MSRQHVSLVAILSILVGGQVARAADKLLFGFETDGELRQWDFAQSSGQLSDQHVTQGSKSLKVVTGETMNLGKPGDWAGYESLDFDAFVDGTDPVSAELVVGDKEWQAKATYWNRHNEGLILRPGQNNVSVAVTGMYRGEAGSRNNDIKTNINPAEIVRFYIAFSAGRGGEKRAVYVDNMRLVKSSRPADVLAFDFGPDSQTVFPGFTPIGPSTVYGQGGNKAGLRAAIPGAGAARDSTFPTRLYQDFVTLGDNEFIVDVPNGKYKAWITFENSGYWGGETSRYRQRTILANGRAVDTDDRGEAGRSDYLFRFEKIEPKPGDSVWDLYVSHLVRARRFEADVTDGRLTLKVEADGPFGNNISAAVLYPANSAEGDKWVAEVEQKNKAEFESRAVLLGPKAKELTIPDAAKAAGYWLGYPALGQTITFVDAPGSGKAELKRIAALNQRVSMTFAIRPLKDLAGQQVSFTATDLKGDGGVIPAGEVDLRYVHHAVSRGMNTVAYQIAPETLRPAKGSGLSLTKDLTRQFWITVHVPADAKAGTYAGEVALKAGDVDVKLPMSVEVLPIKLDEPEYSMGFYGVDVPDGLPGSSEQAWRTILGLLKDNGMNSFSGGPNLTFKGLDEAGKPIIEGYKELDEFFRVCRELGYDKPVMAYGGPGMVGGLHDGYVIGNTGRAWERKTGKTFEELLKIVWGDVKEHAERNNWLPIAYGLTDEPRVIDQVQTQLELMKAYRSAVPFVNIGGSYSVGWDKDDELHKGIQEIFKTLSWSGLGGWGETDVQKAREFDKKLWIYNQGLDRFTWGAYQWAALNKGVVGRMQWHTLCLHGYQFFGLDGREPDIAAVMWGRDGILPTIALPRSREGADDFRYAVTLRNLAEKNKDKPEAQAALAWLKQVADSIPAGRRAVPASLRDDEAFRNTCIEHLRKLMR